MTTLTGRCSCGATTYSVSGDIFGGVLCYCKSCQRTSGGGPNYALLVANHDFSLAGEARVYEHAGGSGAITQKHFCGKCGAHCLASAGANAHIVRIKVASLDDPSGFRPMAQVWTSNAEPWHQLIPDLPSFPENPPGAG